MCALHSRRWRWGRGVGVGNAERILLGGRGKTSGCASLCEDGKRKDARRRPIYREESEVWKGAFHQGRVQ